MKKLHACVAAFAAVSLFAVSAFAAPKPADLTSALISDGERLAIGVHSFEEFRDKPEDSLLKNLLEISGDGPLPIAEKFVSSDLRFAVDGATLKSVALAIEVSEDVTLDELRAAGPADEADFEAPSAEGASITPLAVIKPRSGDEDSAGDIYVAMIERDGTKFLAAVSGSAENLAVMASAAEGSADVPAHVTSNMWAMAECEVDTAPLAGAIVKLELGLDDTRTSVKIYGWSNVFELLALDENGVDVLSGGPVTEAPNLFGSSPLYGLLNVSASFLNPDVEISDIISEEDGFDGVLGALNGFMAKTGLEWSEVLPALRGNITLGIAGSATSPFVPGEYPGVFLNVSGLPDEASEKIIALAKASAGFVQVSEFDDGTMKGIQSSMPVSAVLAYGKGLTAAVMLPDDIEETPKADFAISQAADAHNFALALDVKSLRPVLRQVVSIYGDTLIKLMGGSEEQRDDLDIALASLVAVDGVSIFNEDEVLVAEITPNGDIMSLVYLANKLRK